VERLKLALCDRAARDKPASNADRVQRPLWVISGHHDAWPRFEVDTPVGQVSRDGSGFAGGGQIG
jgi:hypothetical protein